MFIGNLRDRCFFEVKVLQRTSLFEPIGISGAEGWGEFGENGLVIAA